jgi:hypothetical protein
MTHSDSGRPLSDVLARSADIPWVPQGSGNV